MNLGYMKKAIVAGALAAVTAVLSFNIPGWIDGSEPFDYRSVMAAVVAAYLTGLHTFIASNSVPAAPAVAPPPVLVPLVAPEQPAPPDGQAA